MADVCAIANRQYIGARYVPKFFDNPDGSSEWIKNIPYEALVIVTYLGNSYTSKIPVPPNTDIFNQKYWALTGNYNAQVNDIAMTINKLKNVVVNVKDFGAKGDGVAPEDDYFDAALKKLNSYTYGGILFIPKGEYILDRPITITKDKINIVGEGVDSTQIIKHNMSNGIEILKDTDPFLQGNTIRNMTIRYNREAANTGVGIKLQNCAKFELTNLLIRNFATGVYASGGGNGLYQHIGVTSTWTNSVGFDFGERTVSSSCISCYVSFTEGDAITTGIGMKLTRGNIADQNVYYLDVNQGKYGIYIDATDGQNIAPSTDLNFHGCVIDGQYTSGVYLANMPQRCSFNMDGGWFNISSVYKDSACWCVECHNCYNVNIKNVIFQQNTLVSPWVNGIKVTGGNNLNVVGCNFINIKSALNVNTFDQLLFANNTIKLYQGITLEDSCVVVNNSNHNIISGNQIYGNYGRGVLVTATSNNSVVVANVCTGASNKGFEIGGTNKESVANIPAAE